MSYQLRVKIFAYFTEDTPGEFALEVTATNRCTAITTKSIEFSGKAQNEALDLTQNHLLEFPAEYNMDFRLRLFKIEGLAKAQLPWYSDFEFNEYVGQALKVSFNLKDDSMKPFSNIWFECDVTRVEPAQSL